MRRPLVIICILLIAICFIYTNYAEKDEMYNDEIVYIQGVVKSKIEKEKYDEYKINDFLVRDYSKSKNIDIGLELKISGKFKNPNSLNNLEFDYGRYLKSLGIDGIIYIDKYEVIFENKFYKFIGKIKDYIINTNRYLYKENSDFVNSLILGQKHDLSEEQKETFKRSGTSHVIAISGLHTGILCTLISILLKGINNMFKLMCVIITLLIYSIMIGISPSIFRAIFFIFIAYMAIFLDVRKDSISSLALIAIILVINNPYIIYNISFQLSFLATLSIIYFYGYINEVINFKLVSITLASNILTLPIIYYNFKGISMISIIGNIIIIPFIGIIIYMSILSVAIFKISLITSKIIVYINCIIIDSIYFLLYKISTPYLAYIQIDSPSEILVLMYYIIVFSYMVYKELKVIKEQKNELQGYC